MNLSDAERHELQQLQRQRRDNEGYVKVTLLLDKGLSLGSVADDLGSGAAMIYRYAYAFAALGIADRKHPIAVDTEGVLLAVHIQPGDE